MKMVLLSPSPFLFTTNHPFLLHHLCFRNQTRTTLDHKKCRIREKLQICACDTFESITENGFSRRDLVLFGLSYSLSLVFPSLGSHADKELKMVSLVDDINVYSYLYPVELPSKKFLFKWVESRKLERYSSAAPLSPDARLRIVSERFDIIDNLIISVSIGPPNSQFIKTKDKRTWTVKDVADSVLSDKSTLIDGEPYWYYEYLVRKSPTKIAQEPNLYRRYVASTAERDGYLYSLNASTLSKQWNKMGPFLEKTMASFRLNPPTENYVPPYKDPWRFW
ncbi:psbP domain-containing protein 5, chloroplastic-like [Juglans microcarpa x Juglans regia]|uniref:psbP domain-containing protein 5, chloroplastic-like n=1 Tax=Juglans microcarpa x Juglans regia TaxID=2249226 RepID=UPI001B7F49F1|nr:psbP domain-containing protein 5, chloroplastic-like [Juglans microcarpa x Juglans regia]